VTTNAMWQLIQPDVQLGSACDTTISQARAAVNPDKSVCQAHLCTCPAALQHASKEAHALPTVPHTLHMRGRHSVLAARSRHWRARRHFAATQLRTPQPAVQLGGKPSLGGQAPPRPTQRAPARGYRVRRKGGASRLRRACGPVSHPPHRARKPKRGLGGHPAQAGLLRRVPRVKEQPGVQLLQAGARATCPRAPPHGPIPATCNLSRRGGLGRRVWPPSARPAGERGSARGA